MRACLIGLFAAALVGCGASHTTEEDGGIMFDATPPDSGVDGGPRDARVPVCGDGLLDPMEQCDDDNTTPGDGCDGMCRREMYCGDGTVDSGEVCDDGNNASGDGCRSDCQSDESCGNGVRDVVAGEQCDDGNTADGDGCSADCTLLESCGDGTLDDGEQCDDGNTAAWDGCGSDCRVEISMVLDSIEIGGMGVGCDYTGDGRPDNTLARAFGGALDLFSGMIDPAEILLLMHFFDLEDLEGVDDDSVTVAWLQGEDTDGDASNNLRGSAELLASADAFDEDGNPVTSFASRIMSRNLSGGPEDIELPLGLPLPLELKQGRLHGTTTAAGGEMSGVTEGLLCGAVPLSTLALLPGAFIEMAPVEVPPPCDGSTDRGSFADILVGGVSIFGIRVGPAQPDVDLDGDGLEYYETDSGPDCQGVITACIDGDGTRVEGRGCASDPRFADGYSAGLPYTAVRAHIVGLGGTTGGGGGG